MNNHPLRIILWLGLILLLSQPISAQIQDPQSLDNNNPDRNTLNPDPLVETYRDQDILYFSQLKNTKQKRRASTTELIIRRVSNEPPADLAITTAPNPPVELRPMSIIFEVEASGYVRADISNDSGTFKRNLIQAELIPGVYTLWVDIRQWDNDRYYCIVSQEGGQQQTGQFLIRK